ncbi:mitochondrial outer membrane protein porin 6-like [Andrographis paniculata]|uniref:mitochondrial outer membrane protein porin 6-like n=1 Tax=Andrographis paniculata TaxID=175694 RepID=UPI0021E94D0F|nr:mitochondrial outer membrane protein porin 6-like [Andrographis paniculata]XP_051148907.1 mitochondrial outer membrane protein porin 6-like [Andrographis paniculata]
MGNGPAPFSEIGRRARDLLTKDYNYDQKFSLAIPSSTGMGFTATGVKKDEIFIGDISTQYKSGKTTVDVKVDTYSSVSTKVTYDWAPGTKAAISFSVPDHKSGKLDVHYNHRHAVINSSIGLHPSPLLEVAAATGFNDLAVGGEIGFDTSTSSFTKCNAGISFNKPDFSAAVILADKGQTVKASYVHLVNPLTGTEVAAEMTHSLSGSENTFSIGSIHKLDAFTSVKTRLSYSGKLAVLTQREWRPKSFATVSTEYDTKAANAAPKFGLSIAFKP